MSSDDELTTVTEVVVDEHTHALSSEQIALQTALQKNVDLEGALRAMERHASLLAERLTAVTSEATQQRQRIERDRDEAVKHGNEVLVAELAPILDDLARAKAAGEQLGTEGAPFVDGVRLVEDRFIAVLRRFGATIFSTVGEAFDPRRAEAIAVRADSNAPAGVVVEELRRGVMLHDRLIRPALVVVSMSSES